MARVFPVIKHVVVAGDAVVEWTPHGAEVPEVGLHADLPALELVSERVVGVQPSLAALEAELAAQTVGVAGQLDAEASLVGPSVGLATALGLETTVGGAVGVAAAVPTLEATTAQGVGISAALPALESTLTTPGVGLDVPALGHELTFIATGALVRDTWIPNVAGCLDNANKNGTDLQLEGVVATRKDVYVGWDLTNLPSGATATAATLTVNVKTAPTTSADVTLNRLADADENWTEAGLTCSGAKALTSTQTWTNPFATTGDKSLALNSTWLTRIQSRMGSGLFSIVLTGATLLSNMVLESTDEGTNDAAGPRLSITYTTPT